ncbi:MAG: PEP/pyruvate-binding domain-containing protein [Patescibacteria group bacterium UBA2103]
MNKFLFNSKDVKNSPSFGGKANSIISFSSLLYSIPKTFVLADSAFSLFQETNCLKTFQEFLNESLAKGGLIKKKQFDELRQLYESGNLPEDVNIELTDFITKQESGSLYAVRSSASCEDGVEKAWAGQFNTFLNVPRSELKNYVKKCWASIFSPGVYYYAKKSENSISDIKMAVVIQEMVPADIAGVCFTKNPITGNDQELVIEACRGLGETLVSGLIVPESYFVSKKTGEVFSVSKRRQNKILHHGRGHSVESHTMQNPNSNLLDKQKIEVLLRVAHDLEELFGTFQDFEWAFSEKQFYLLQSRPITSI